MSLTSRLREALRDKTGSVMIDSAVSSVALGLITVSTVSLFAVFLTYSNANADNLDQDRANRNAVSQIVTLKGDDVTNRPEVRSYDGESVKVWANDSNGQTVIYASDSECNAPSIDGCRFASQHLISGQGSVSEDQKRDIHVTDDSDTEYDLKVPTNTKSIRYLFTDVPVGSTLIVHPGEDTTVDLPLMRHTIPLPGADQDRDSDGKLKYVSGIIELPKKVEGWHAFTVEVIDHEKNKVAVKPFFYTLDKAE
ncbi:hypothetical protein ACTXJX_11845 [Glutamicibacter ardleyensis]|uniref:hypothetical protein n=1 Tax=Glutamicibacter ardleyensis TaxID=225894 RepID=UPI003FD5901B